MNKATVCRIANRLSRTVSRKEAFTEAWRIVKNGAVSFPVRGVTVGSRQEALRRLPRYEPADVIAFIMPEPENPVDRNAIAVMVGVNYGKGYYKLGYVPKVATATAAAVAAVHGKASIKVIGCDIRGARLTLAV